MTSAEQLINVLAQLKTGELGLFRAYAGQGLDESVEAFDMFAGLWWPLRQTGKPVPRREVAWLITKLFASCPTAHSPGDGLARQLRRCEPNDERERERFRLKFDKMLALPLDGIEPTLRWAIAIVGSDSRKLDWVQLVADLSRWEHETKRREWARQYYSDQAK